MQFGLNDEQLAAKEAARRLAQDRFAPRAAEIDASAEFPWDNVRLLREAGFLGMAFPEEYGGGGADHVSHVAVKEEIARACLSTCTIMAAQYLGSLPLMLAGTPQQKARFLPPLAAGERLAAFGLTEAGAGSDASAMRTSARRDGDSYVLTGVKCFVTNGGAADFYTVFAKTDPQAGTRGISAFMVEKGTPGFSFGKSENKLGIRASATRELVFDECRVPVENRLGAEGSGYKLALRTLDHTRPGVGAEAVGVAQAAFDAALRYASERSVFGSPLAEKQVIAFMLADMATQLEAARLLVYRVAALIDAGATTFTLAAAQAKLFASEMAHHVVDKALQIHGGYGYMKEFPLERYYRDQRITEIYEGTSEIQRLVIAAQLLRNGSGERR
ncbi:MAG: acyl-CoA dehydrogenase family protein [Anaerolineales bacterium]|nr:acyl-CoA dehydrogenase family protein [Anaerolineales bacterium]